MRVQNELQVVNDAALRKKIIDEINGPENQDRKAEAYRRHKCYKDKTSEYVVLEILKQFDDDTVREMAYSISNISIGRKIVDKLARVYSNGVVRNSKNAQKQVDDVAKLCQMNRNMKQANRYLRAHRNTMVGVLPCPYYDNDDQVSYEIKIQPLQPHLYDVIEHEDDRERAMFVILSNYAPKPKSRTSIDPAKEGRGFMNVQPTAVSDGRDEAIADKKEDEGPKNHYIWWSKHYHFTTNEKGEFVPNGFEKTPGTVAPEDIVNPIQELPWVNFAIDQEGSFWSEGGNDVFDGAVKVNCMLTHVDHIGVNQGYGQFYMKGKNLPRFIKAGVNKTVLMEFEKDDPVPDIGFAASNPKLEELKNQIVMYVALLLTTNNLSTRAVATELSGSSDFASGIALMIDKADSIEDVQDQRDIFEQNEPEIFELIAKWQQVYKNDLTDDWKQAMLPDGVEVTLKFNDPLPIMSEKEKLEALQLRKGLGLNTIIELLMKDDPSLTQEDAQKRLKSILEDRIANALLHEGPKQDVAVPGDGAGTDTTDKMVADKSGDPGQVSNPNDRQGANGGDQSNKGAGVGGPNNVDNRPGPGGPPTKN